MKKFLTSLMFMAVVALVIYFQVCEQCRKCRENGCEEAGPIIIGTIISNTILGKYNKLLKTAKLLGIIVPNVKEWFIDDNQGDDVQGGAIVEVNGEEERINVTEYTEKWDINSEDKFWQQKKKVQKIFEDCTDRVLATGESDDIRRFEMRIECLKTNGGYDDNDVSLYKYHAWIKK